jgi:heme exporter protein B
MPHSEPPLRPPWYQELVWIIGQDLRAERRGLGLLSMTVLMAVAVVVACALAGGQGPSAALTAAAIWVALACCVVYAASNAYLPEQQSGLWQALVAGPVRSLPLYLAKTGLILGVTLLGALVAAALALLLIETASLLAEAGRLLAVIALGSLGFSAVGGLMAPLLGLGAGREALLALVLLPLGVPVVVAGANATVALAAQPADLDGFRDSTGILLVLDTFFLLLAIWLFEPLLGRHSSSTER